jgi:hypothetical protein
MLLGSAVFVAPLGIWLAYSRRITSPGGLTAFVEAAAGRRVALVQGWIWIVSYFLYLPYTVTYVVYDVLPILFPGIGPDRGLLELALPAAIVALVLAPITRLLVAFAAVAAIQLALLLVLAAVELANAGAPASGFSRGVAFDSTSRATAGVALLYVCASLPLFLGRDVRGGSRTVRWALAASFALVAGYLLLDVLPLAGVAPELRFADLPGVAIAQSYSGRPLALAVGLGAAASVTAVIVAEYLALSRLLHYLHGLEIRTALLWIAVPFVVADALSLIDPAAFYDDLLRPSLAALFASQLVVVAVYPLYRRRIGERVGAAPLVATAVAAALMGWGFYTAVTTSGGT